MLEIVLQLGVPAGAELLLILLIAVLLFGANKIPKLARASGKALGEFKKGREEIQQEIEEGVEDIEGEETAESRSTVTDDS